MNSSLCSLCLCVMGCFLHLFSIWGHNLEERNEKRGRGHKQKKENEVKAAWREVINEEEKLDGYLIRRQVNVGIRTSRWIVFHRNRRIPLVNDFWTIFLPPLSHLFLFSVSEQKGNDSCLLRTPALSFFITPSSSSLVFLYRLCQKQVILSCCGFLAVFDIISRAEQQVFLSYIRQDANISQLSFRDR